MGSLSLRRRLIKWGHGYGIRVTRGEAGRLGLREKSAVNVRVEPATGRLNLADFHLVPIGRDASRRHEQIAAGNP